MIDSNALVVAALESTNVPTYYEYFVDSDTPIPCLTYYEANNADYLRGSTLNYSNLATYVKVYGYDISTLTVNSALVDAAMKNLGYKRVNTNMMWLDNIGQYILRYEAIGYEHK